MTLVFVLFVPLIIVIPFLSKSLSQKHPGGNYYHLLIFPLTPLGVFASRLRMLDDVAGFPIDMNFNFCRTCQKSPIQTYPPTPQK